MRRRRKCESFLTTRRMKWLITYSTRVSWNHFVLVIANTSLICICRTCANCRQVLPNIFAEAARRAREAGFDGVELHYAHAYTMAGFLSALNDRDDGYGGSRENRLRLPLEVFQAVRNTVGNDYVVGAGFWLTK